LHPAKSPVENLRNNHKVYPEGDGPTIFISAISSTAGKYGDLQGIAGKGLNEIEGLEIAMLPSEIMQN
jgi:hypothetical protein